MSPSRPWVRTFAVLWLAVGALSAAAREESARPPITAELAPDELAAIVAKDALIATADKGRELWVYLPEAAVVQRFTEKGSSWGDPIPLRIEALRHPITFIRMDINGNDIALSGHTGVAVFSARDGSLRGQRRIFQPSDVAALGAGRYALALTNVPHPVRKGSFLGRRSFGDDVPRVVVYDDDGDMEAKGLIEGEAEHPLRATARSLRLAWGDKVLWAGEIGSYRLLKLAPDLELQDQLHDPELDFTPPVAEEASDDEQENDAADEAESAGVDLTSPDPVEISPRSQSPARRLASVPGWTSRSWSILTGARIRGSFTGCSIAEPSRTSTRWMSSIR